MAATFGTLVKRGGNTGRAVAITTLDITLDNSYPAGGYPITAAQLGFSGGLFATSMVTFINGANILLGWYDIATSKLRVFYPTGGGGTAPTTVAQPVLQSGGTTVTANAASPNFIPGAGKEVPTGCVLTNFVGRIMAFGQ